MALIVLDTMRAADLARVYHDHAHDRDLGEKWSKLHPQDRAYCIARMQAFLDALYGDAGVDLADFTQPPWDENPADEDET